MANSLKKGRLLRTEPPEREVVYAAAKILEGEHNSEAVSRLRAYFRNVLTPEREEIHEIIGYDE
jgi:hypothetical protein